MKKGDKDFSAAVTQIKGVSPDAVFYSGYYAEAAPLVQQLKDGGVDGDVRQRRRHQGSASSSSRRANRPRTPSCPARAARPPARSPRSTQKKFGQEPGTYSTEGYDLGTILLKGIDSGAITRPALLDFVQELQRPGRGP